MQLHDSPTSSKVAMKKLLFGIFTHRLSLGVFPIVRSTIGRHLVSHLYILISSTRYTDCNFLRYGRAVTTIQKVVAKNTLCYSVSADGF